MRSLQCVLRRAPRDAPGVVAPGFGPSLRVSCVEHRETLPALSMTSTVLPRVLRGPLRTFVALVVDVNEIYGLIVVFTGKYGPAKS